MKISTKGIYALNILTNMAQNNDKIWTVTELASKNNVSVKYLERIISKLVKGNILKSFRGSNGGYMLCRQPDKITLRSILEATEGRLKTVSCLASTTKCDKISSCKSARVWQGLEDTINTYLESRTLQSILDNN